MFNLSSGVVAPISVHAHGVEIVGYAHHDGHVSFMLDGVARHFASIADAVKAWPFRDGTDAQ